MYNFNKPSTPNIPTNPDSEDDGVSMEEFPYGKTKEQQEQEENEKARQEQEELEEEEEEGLGM